MTDRKLDLEQKKEYDFKKSIIALRHGVFNYRSLGNIELKFIIYNIELKFIIYNISIK